MTADFKPLNATCVPYSLAYSWRTGKHGMLQSMGSWRVGHKWPTTILLNNLKSVILKKANDHFLWPSLKLLLLLLRRFSRVWLCVIPETAAHQAPPSLGFSRQEHWSGLPFPSPMHESEKWNWGCSVVSDSLRPHGLQPTRLLCPWDFPGRSTGVGCCCFLQLSS